MCRVALRLYKARPRSGRARLPKKRRVGALSLALSPRKAYRKGIVREHKCL